MCKKIKSQSLIDVTNKVQNVVSVQNNYDGHRGDIIFLTIILLLAIFKSTIIRVVQFSKHFSDRNSRKRKWRKKS